MKSEERRAKVERPKPKTAKKTAPVARPKAKGRVAGVVVSQAKGKPLGGTETSPPYRGAALPGTGLVDLAYKTLPRAITDDWLEYSAHPVAAVLREYDLTCYERKILVYYLTVASGCAAVAARLAGYEPRGGEARKGEKGGGYGAAAAGYKALHKAQAIAARTAIGAILYEGGVLESKLWTMAHEATGPRAKRWIEAKFATGPKGETLLNDHNRPICLTKGRWEYSEGDVDFEGRVKAAEKLRALMQGRQSDDTDGAIHIHLDPRLLPANSSHLADFTPLDTGESSATSGYYPALEDKST